jgi:predicted CXXCH cytochrome family protein
MSRTNSSSQSLQQVLRTVLISAMLLCGGAAVASAQNAPAPFAPAPTKNSCLDCHSVMPENLNVSEDTYSHSIHAQKGVTCANCHGGDPTNDDADKAMSRKAGFKGHIDRKQIPLLCSSCHSDAERMKRSNPGLRVDQFQQYKTSVHGMKWAKGDPKVAVCTDCHGTHDLFAPSDPRSKVHPPNIAGTCARCHADAAYMKPYGIKTDQFANYKQSVHHEAMTVRGDLSAPTCTTCHGNHGATPPGVANVANVCSNCHVFQAQLFAASPHKVAFANMGFPGCVTCHSNHGIKHPDDDMIGAGPKSVCTQCHSDGDGGFVQAAAMHQQLTGLAQRIAASDQLLQQAERQGMEVSASKLQEMQARDALLKARVTIHSANNDELKKDIEPGLVVAQKTYAAGQQAMKEWHFRRVGLWLSLGTILLTLIGLGLFIRNMER